ncbi:hypothetical protein CHRYSEOSP005_07100 [Chryseobacterium sp. Alg-005]|uniref:hypothetical protein n=1 Tax=Chryseobacterium sp. Alg-005 TaxID=3159516 RepID=UPI003555B96B
MKQTREQLLNEALELIKKYGVSAYEISQNTSLSDVGILKIINGDTKRPLELTLLTIIGYIKEKYGVKDKEEVVYNTFNNKFVELPNGQYLMYMPLFEYYAQAGFVDNDCNIAHPDYEDIEQHTIIVDKPLHGKYVAWRIKGDSMNDGTDRSIVDGSIVSTRELKRDLWSSKLHLHDFNVWVICSTSFGRPTLKEITKHEVETGTIVCDSWNPSLEYSHNVSISLNDVKALFYAFDVSKPISKKLIY